jgi:hypothetical protein
MGSNMNRTIDATILHYCSTPPNGHRIYVTDVGPNDVLLGRGKQSDRLEGNVQFRGIVNQRLHEYAVRGHTKAKDSLAKSIVALIERRGGRFLQVVARTTTTTELTTTKLSIASSSSTSSSKASIGRNPTYNNTRLYQIVEYDVALDKVKQTFRSMIHQYVKLKRRDYVDFDETDRQIYEYAKRKKQRDDDDDGDDTDTDRATTVTRDPCTAVGMAPHPCDAQIRADSNVPVHSNPTTAKDRTADATGINFHPNVSAAGITVGNSNNNNNTNDHLGIHTNSSYGLTPEQQLHLLSPLQLQQQLVDDAINILNQRYRLQQQQQQQCLDDIALLLQLHRQIHTYPPQLLVGCAGTNGRTMQDTLRIRQLEALLAAVRQSNSIHNPTSRSTSTAGIAGDTFPSNNGDVMDRNFRELLAASSVWTNETLYHHGGGEGSNVVPVTVLHEIEDNQETKDVN